LFEGEHALASRIYAVDLAWSSTHEPGFLEDFLRENLDEPWKECELPRPSWPIVTGDSTRMSAWMNPIARRLLGVAANTSSTGQRDSSVRLFLAEDPDTWDLVRRAFCDQRDRTLFCPLSIEMALEYCAERHSGSRFDSVAWQDGNASTRGIMAADLICRGFLLGLAPSEVSGLLGPPDDREGSRMVYRLFSETDLSGGALVSSNFVCKDDWYELIFDFSMTVPASGPQVFQLGKICERKDA